MKIKETKLNWTLNVVARVVVGLVFLFSSFVKGVDPLGTSFKITEYLTAWSPFGISLEWLTPLAPVMSMGLITAEFLVGVLLLTGAFRRLSAWLLVLMMLFFTCTTLVDAITNKVTDCGCFGDAVKLTNWQTFWKNVALDVPTLWIFLTRDLRRKKRFERDVLITIFAIVAMVVFGLYNINNEPCIDFRSWKVGNQMIEMDENAQVKSYVTYRNTETGETEEFLSEELVKRMEEPGWEQKWEWESSRVVDPREIAAPGFSMLDMEGEDRATDLLPADDGLLIATIHHIEKVDAKGTAEVRRALTLAEENGIRMVLLTAALPEEVQAWMTENGIEGLDYLFADATAIETMMRGNPGFMYMRDGVVVDKGRSAVELKIEN